VVLDLGSGSAVLREGRRSPQRSSRVPPVLLWGRVASHEIQLPGNPSSLALNASRDGAPATSRGKEVP